jgi:hypothetical protein
MKRMTKGRFIPAFLFLWRLVFSVQEPYSPGLKQKSRRECRGGFFNFNGDLAPISLPSCRQP